jgi:hypothetical protein
MYAVQRFVAGSAAAMALVAVVLASALRIILQDENLDPSTIAFGAAFVRGGGLLFAFCVETSLVL